MNCRQTVNPRYFGKYSAGQIYSGGGSSNACYPFITSALIGPQYWPQLHNVTLGNIPIANKEQQRRQQCKDSNNADNNNKDNNITLEQFHANLSSPMNIVSGYSFVISTCTYSSLIHTETIFRFLDTQVSLASTHGSPSVRWLVILFTF